MPSGWMQGPVLHDLHHKVGRVNFQKYFTYLDYLAGTLQLQPDRIVSSEKKEVGKNHAE